MYGAIIVPCQAFAQIANDAIADKRLLSSQPVPKTRRAQDEQKESALSPESGRASGHPLISPWGHWTKPLAR
jgi:hypothetical protein